MGEGQALGQRSQVRAAPAYRDTPRSTSPATDGQSPRPSGCSSGFLQAAGKFCKMPGVLLTLQAGPRGGARGHPARGWARVSQEGGLSSARSPLFPEPAPPAGRRDLRRGRSYSGRRAAAAPDGALGGAPACGPPRGPDGAPSGATGGHAVSPRGRASRAPLSRSAPCLRQSAPPPSPPAPPPHPAPGDAVTLSSRSRGSQAAWRRTSPDNPFPLRLLAPVGTPAVRRACERSLRHLLLRRRAHRRVFAPPSFCHMSWSW